MQQIKYNGVTYNVYAQGENPKWKYQSIANSETGERAEREQRTIARKFIEINGETPKNIDKNEGTTFEWINQLLKILKKSDAIRELDDSDNSRKTSIDFIFTLNYIEKYGNKPYKSPEKCTTQAERDEILDIKNNAQKANGEVTKMARVIQAEYNLNSWESSAWTDGSHTKVRDYLWIEMRYEDYKDNKNSISIFVNKSIPGVLGRDKPRIRFSIEMRDSGATKADYDDHYRFLDMPLKPGLCYIVGSDQLHDAAVLNEDADTVKQKLKEGTYKKVKISKVIDYDPSLTNEQIYNEMMQGVKDLIPYYDHVIGKINKTNQPAGTKTVEEKIEVKNMKEKIGLNTILFGPPGTGKTYNTKKYAVAICDYNGDLSSVEKLDYDTVITPRYNELVSEGRVQFTTFHQSYGYEEFIEGIKPETNANGNVSYHVRAGVFKAFCEKAKCDIDKVLENSPSIYKVTLKEGASNDVKNNCFKEGLIRLDYDDNQKYLDDNFSKLNVGDIVLSLKSANSLDGIGVVTDNTPFDLDNEKEYKHAIKVNWLLTNLDINTLKYNDNKQFASNSTISSTSFSIETFKAMVNDYDLNKKKPFVFIIDEINRGNISKIFGELITLIEESKRGGAKEEMSATLPYSGECFSVPNNVYILGTMNTADRSISLMDTALRRRFDFIEMMPKTSIVNKIVAGVDIEKMLKTINDRITVLYDREHTIGHAFFTGLNSNSTIDDLEAIFKNKVIPLLQEYFYEDYSKIRLVLGDNGKADTKYQFIHEINNSTKNVFKGNYDPDLVENFSYEINNEALKEPESYIQIYK